MSSLKASQEAWCLQLVHEAVENDPVMQKIYHSIIIVGICQS